jgi:eukaryotic-like serine/threonine-protein kinase
MIGETIGSYVIEARLGGGGMGEVFLATHQRISRRVAIKVLLPAYSRDPGIVQRLRTEARATALIEHPGIVQVFDCDVLPSGHAYIVMEYLRGETLRQCLDRVGRLTDDLPAALDLVAQIASALGAAHDKGIIHRDLKPDNVFLTQGTGGREGIVVKILDFGIAKVVAEGAGSVSLTRTGSLLGTPLYMSPEQCRSAARIDHRTDIYSLGCILFEMTCGRPPFIHETMGDLIIAHGTEPPPAPHDLGVMLPEALETLIGRMLAKSPDDRPQTMKDVVTGLRAAGAAMPNSTMRIETRPLPVWAGPAPTPAPPTATPQMLTPQPRVPTPVRYGGMMAPTAPVQPFVAPRTTLAQTAGEMEQMHIRRSRAPLFFVVLLAGAAAGGAYLFLGRPAPKPEEAPAALPAPAPLPAPAVVPRDPEPPPPERPTMVTVQLVGAPANLEVAVDGKRTSLPLRLRRDGQSREIIFSAPGYRDQVEMLVPDSDQTVKLSMQKVAVKAPERPHRPPRERPAPAPAPVSRPPQVTRPLEPPPNTQPTPPPKRKLPTPLNDL